MVGQSGPYRDKVVQENTLHIMIMSIKIPDGVKEAVDLEGPTEFQEMICNILAKFRHERLEKA